VCDTEIRGLACAGADPGISAHPADSFSHAVPADGTWAGSTRQLTPSTYYFARAEQTDAAGNVFVSTVAGPVRTGS
jgi:hypothetical protein